MREQLISEINHLQNDSKISNVIENKIESFEYFKKMGTNEELFSELCYCILTANCQAKSCMIIQESFPFEFSCATEDQIRSHLIKQRYRFPNIRTGFIFDAQMNKDNLRMVLNNHSGQELREWFVDHIKGLGMKEASHFLRNIGYKNYAIVDKHIMNIAHDYQIIDKPKTITKKNYLLIEQELLKIAQDTKLDLATLDLYLWYMQTGMILK